MNVHQLVQVHFQIIQDIIIVKCDEIRWSGPVCKDELDDFLDYPKWLSEKITSSFSLLVVLYVKSISLGDRKIDYYFGGEN